MAKTVGSFLRGFLIGLVGIYLVLSFHFHSYVAPLIVMMTIPLAFLGAIWGRVLMGYKIAMPSLVGAASLAGIVVNNAVVPKDFPQRWPQARPCGRGSARSSSRCRSRSWAWRPTCWRPRPRHRHPSHR
ncbi:efflux RND transporter permease subunit [Yoonia sp.]|uniref:efflux RND transporter permease subunit n=1 Tax=Yoonia sp. TaxID=2212373 RepID=UPI0025D2A9FF|nr:efflux RND transporter permease subunit [Yoonia sp.]